MEQKAHLPIEEMEVFRRYLEIADWVWNLVSEWPPLALDTVGKQILRAVDSVGANLVEGDGRHSQADALHFFVIARASARETRYWLERAMSRDLISVDEGSTKTAELAAATRLLNRLITYRRRGQPSKGRVAEELGAYEASSLEHSGEVAGPDPFAVE